jgi:hypothetical protein
MKPVVLLTVIGIEAVAPAITGTVAAVVAMAKVWVVGVSVRLMVVGITVAPVVALTVIACVPKAMFADVAIVKVTFCEWTPSRITLAGLKLQVAPGETPAVQPPIGVLVELKLTAWLNPLTGATAITVVAGCPAETLSVVRLGVKVKGTVTVIGVAADIELGSLEASPS